MNEAINHSRPSEWCVARLGDVAEIRAGFGFPNRLQGRTEGELPFAKVGDISACIKAGSRELGTANHYIDRAELSGIGARSLPPQSIVFAKIGEAIRLNRRVITTREMVFDNNTMGLVANASLLEPRFLLHFMRTVDLYAIANATTVPSIRKSDIADIEIPLPPLREQRRIVEKLELIDAKNSGAREALVTVGPLLEQFRQSVLAAAFRGDLTANWRKRNESTGPASPDVVKIDKSPLHEDNDSFQVPPG